MLLPNRPHASRLLVLIVAPILGVLSGGTFEATISQTRADTRALDVSKIGPQIGDKAPDFSLREQEGEVNTLSSLLGPKGLILVFIRSADWSLECKSQLLELQGHLGDIRKAGMGLAVISHDPVSVLADFSVRRGITFPMLSDTGSATIKLYGILNTTVPATNEFYGYPFPGTFVIDQQGVVTARFFEQTYQERSTVTSILARLGGKVDVPGGKVSAPHLEITSYSTDQVVAPGTHFSLVLDITPAPRVHIYARGVTRYQPIALTIQAQPGLVIRESQLPTAEDYFFKPLDEHVPVYQKAFRLIQDVTVDPSYEVVEGSDKSLRNLKIMAITAALNYQACDDSVCFDPQSVPLSWTIRVKSHDAERARKR